MTNKEPSQLILISLQSVHHRKIGICSLSRTRNKVITLSKEIQTDLNEFGKVSLVRLMLLAAVRLPTDRIIPVEVKTSKVMAPQECQHWLDKSETDKAIFVKLKLKLFRLWRPVRTEEPNINKTSKINWRTFRVNCKTHATEESPESIKYLLFGFFVFFSYWHYLRLCT